VIDLLLHDSRPDGRKARCAYLWGAGAELEEAGLTVGGLVLEFLNLAALRFSSRRIFTAFCAVPTYPSLNPDILAKF
jgi:hypothetical protein